MTNNEDLQAASQLDRRTVLKSMAATAAVAALGGLSRTATAATTINPRWYGFNLLEYFSTDPDWMKYFPYKDDGRFQEDDFRWIRDWGFNWVRLPMDYRFWTDPRDMMKIDERKVEPIDRAIRLGEKYSIHVNICLHRAPGECILDTLDEKSTGIHIEKEKTSVYSDAATAEAFAHQWSFFAKRYKGISNTNLSFNLVNDPNEPGKSDEVGASDYARVAKVAIAAIREIDSGRLIISDGYPVGGKPVAELFETKVMQSPHDYIPGQVTHYRTPWARPGIDNAPVPTWPAKDANGKVVADKETIRKALSPWADLAAHNIPIHFGEIGCNKYAAPEVAYAWFNDTLDLIGELQSGWALWNFRGSFGILDTERAGTKFKNWHGHQLDFTLLTMLQRKMRNSQGQS